MIGYRYNPFSKPLAEFLPDELNVLRDVSEGWFIDYKSEPLSPKDFGKHLSAFANQFGGWLFVGIKEGANKSLKAGSFPGIPASDVGAVLVKIREGVSAHVSPSFYFDHRIIDGPVDAIGLEAGRSIIVVAVPEGPNPPFVHSSGKIYRRIADSSEPKAEIDRAVLDAMWRKSDAIRTQLREFILKPTESRLTENTYCHVYLLEDLALSPHRYDLDIQGFKDAMQRDRTAGASMPLDNFHATQDGFIGRHLFNNNPLMDLVALRWWRNGNVRLTIPISPLYVSPERLHADERFRDFVSLMEEVTKLQCRILNLDQWLFAVFALTHRYLDLRDVLGSKEPIYAKVVFSNARSSTPFIAMDSYLKRRETVRYSSCSRYHNYVSSRVRAGFIRFAHRRSAARRIRAGL